MLPPEDEGKVSRDAGVYWTDSGTSVGKQDLSHWRNIGRWDDSTWREMGNDRFRLFTELCSIAKVESCGIRKMVEWGQGGGANAMAFAGHVSEFIGVDISRPNLEECERQLTASGFDNFRPVWVKPQTPESVLDEVDEVDFFLSTAVFQHFPSREYGVRILKIAYQLLADDGVALIQIRYDNSDTRFLTKGRDYRRNAITFTSYTLDGFWNRCQDVGLTPMYMTLDPTSNYAYYFLRKATSAI